MMELLLLGSLPQAYTYKMHPGVETSFLKNMIKKPWLFG